MNCVGKVRSKRLSFILPDAEEEDATDSESLPRSGSLHGITVPNTTEKMVHEIRREVREVVRNELQTALQFFSDKIDDYEVKMKDYENECTALRNVCSNLSLKNEVLEQKINGLEQFQLRNEVEIHGVKEVEGENVKALVDSICTKIQQRPSDIICARRKRVFRSDKQKDKQSPLLVSLREGCRGQWLASARNANIISQDLGMEGDCKVYVQEALTPQNAFLLWKAKMVLKSTGLCKYAWFKDGVILVRRAEKEKAQAIRSTKDIDRIADICAG